MFTNNLNTHIMSFSFWGNSNFSKLILSELIANQLTPDLIVTFSPKEFGRKKILKSNPVEELAKQHKIEVIYADNINDQSFYDNLKSKKIDVGIVASFGKIIPKNILKVFQFGLINIHPSLLPKYRGPTPIQNAILNNDVITGTTIFIIDELMDHGPIIGQISSPITLDDDFNSLKQKLGILGAKLIINLLPDYLNHRIAIKPQEENLATYTKKFYFENCHLDWSQPTATIYNFVRALSFEPGTFNYFEKNSKKIILKILKINWVNDSEVYAILNQKYSVIANGSIVQENKHFFVKTLDGFVEIITVHPDGKTPMPFQNFYNGNKIDKLI